MTDQSLHDAVGVLGEKRKLPRSIRAEWSEIFESAAEVTVTPARWDPWESMIAQNTGVFFTITIQEPGQMRKMYGGLAIGQRALLVDLLAEETRQEQRAYLQQPVDFLCILPHLNKCKRF